MIMTSKVIETIQSNAKAIKSNQIIYSGIDQNFIKVLRSCFLYHSDFNNIVLPILAVNLMKLIVLPLPSIAELPDDDES